MTLRTRSTLRSSQVSWFVILKDMYLYPKITVHSATYTLLRSDPLPTCTSHSNTPMYIPIPPHTLTHEHIHTQVCRVAPTTTPSLVLPVPSSRQPQASSSSTSSRCWQTARRWLTDWQRGASHSCQV